MEHFAEPPIRRLFKPDPGYLICDADLSGADAQVVAWESGEPELKRAFKEGLDVHNFNGTRLWGTAYDPERIRRKLTWRDECKRAVHGTNYLAGIRGLAHILGWSMAEVEGFQHAWFSINPRILDWHRRVEHNIQKSRTVANKFGLRITYFDRPDNVLPKAVAWIPQSTVATCCSRGAVQLHENLPWVDVLLQVHDSVVFQLPFHRVSPSSFAAIREHLNVTVPYPSDPLIIPWGLATSERTWADVKKRKWEEVL